VSMAHPIIREHEFLIRETWIFGQTNIERKDNMKMEQLKNYGKSLIEMIEDVPQKIIKEISDSSFNIIKRHLNSDDLERFMSSFPEEKERMSKKNLSPVRKKGLNSEEFIHQQIEWAASFSTASKIIGNEKALNVFREIIEKTYPKLFFNMFPTSEDLDEFDDPFNAFKEWFLIMMEANRSAGLFDCQLTENTDDTFQMDCIWCAWHEIYKQLGVEEACIPVCHADDAFYPDYFQKTGIRYKRKQTLGWGNNCCDFRFERSAIAVR
jgi:hypothetical protein